MEWFLDLSMPFCQRAGMRSVYIIALGVAVQITTSASARDTSDLADIPLGIEAVTGYRSEYIHRGFKLANDLFDFQLEVEIALTNQLMLNSGAWFATGVGSGDLEETAGFIGIRQECEQLTYGIELTWRSLRHSDFKSGLDIAPYASWHFSDDFGLTAGVAWDTGASGLYSFLEGVWSKPVGDSAFIKATGGVSAVSSYYDRSGLNDLYGRLSYTYAINRSVALTPFLETSVPIRSHGETVRAVAGIWFEVNF